jgi:hypothetical protein
MVTTPTASDTRNASHATEFRDLLAFVRPKPEELRWQSIPWQTDLRAARPIAQEAGKPIFLYAMNGNPLGCT